jgi:hypothetical protein
MSVPVTPLGVVGLIAVIYLVYIFANLSQRLGAVTKMLARVIRSNGLLNNSLIYVATYHLPFVIAVAISVGIAWYYWSWLFKEKLT